MGISTTRIPLPGGDAEVSVLLWWHVCTEEFDALRAGEAVGGRLPSVREFTTDGRASRAFDLVRDGRRVTVLDAGPGASTSVLAHATTERAA